MLLDFYKVKANQELIDACENDWRFCIPSDIAEGGFIPRTPYVLLSGDANWHGLDRLESRLLEVVEEKRRTNQKSRRP